MHEEIGVHAGEALEKLKLGNEKYLKAQVNTGDISPAIRLKTYEKGQSPYAVIVTCSDSRVIPESIFSAGIGELFVIRVAGNVIDNHQLGSVEYAAEHLGCRLVVVMGHTNCGAVDAAISGDPEGYVKFITDEIKEAIGEETDDYQAGCLNVNRSVSRIRAELSALCHGDENDVRVVGAMYHIDTGIVDFLPEEDALEDEALRRQYYIAFSESNNAQSGTFLSSLTQIGSRPQDREALDALLIDFAEEDGCGELDWAQTEGRFEKGGITADLEVSALQATLSYDICEEADLISRGITFENLEQTFRHACAGADLQADFEEGAAFAYADPVTGKGQCFSRLRDTNPVTYAEFIRDLVKFAISDAGEADPAYADRLKRLLNDFTRESDRLRRL